MSPPHKRLSARELSKVILGREESKGLLYEQRDEWSRGAHQAGNDPNMEIFFGPPQFQLVF